MNIRFPNDKFDFSKLHIARPQKHGKGVFSKILYDDTDENLYIQTPKCKTKNGIIKQNSKVFTDLMFNNNNNALLLWLENLVEHIKDSIYSAKDVWFAQDDLDKEDLDEILSPVVKTYKAVNFLLRANIVAGRGAIRTDNYKIYNESEQPRELDDIKPDSDLIGILEIQGIKCSESNFQIEFALSQIMIFENTNLECMIKPSAINTIDIKETTTNKEVITSDTNIDNKDNENNEINEKIDNTNSLEETIDNNPETIDTEQDIENKNNEPDIDKKENDLDNIITVLNDDGTGNLVENIENIKLDILPTDNDILQLKKPNEVYIGIYREAYRKAKDAKKLAIEAYLRAKNIKQTYALDIADESDDEDFQELLVKS